MPLALLLIIAGGAAVAWAIAHQGDLPAGDIAQGDDSRLPDPVDTAAPDLAPAAPDTNILGFEMPTVNKWTPPKTAAPYLDTIAKAEQKNGLPDGLLARLLYQESRYRPEIINGTVKSPVGALGIAQFMPATAKDRGVDPLDPNSAINGAAAYLRSLFNQTGSWAGALAAYNWGVGNVKRKGLGALPAETRAYVDQITADVGLA